MKTIFYVHYLSVEHLRLIRDKYHEEHCIFIEGVVCVKMVSAI